MKMKGIYASLDEVCDELGKLQTQGIVEGFAENFAVKGLGFRFFKGLGFLGFGAQGL